MNYWPHLLAVLVGAGLTVQIGMNSTVRMVIGSPLIATIVNFSIGLAALTVVAVTSGSRVVPGSTAAVPAWAWLGGILGAILRRLHDSAGSKARCRGPACTHARRADDRRAARGPVWSHRISAECRDACPTAGCTSW